MYLSGSCMWDRLKVGEAREGEAAWGAAAFSLEVVVSRRVTQGGASGRQG